MQCAFVQQCTADQMRYTSDTKTVFGITIYQKVSYCIRIGMRVTGFSINTAINTLAFLVLPILMAAVKNNYGFFFVRAILFYVCVRYAVLYYLKASCFVTSKTAQISICCETYGSYLLLLSLVFYALIVSHTFARHSLHLVIMTSASSIIFSCSVLYINKLRIEDHTCKRQVCKHYNRPHGSRIHSVIQATWEHSSKSVLMYFLDRMRMVCSKVDQAVSWSL